jgi:hypothetical protein
MRELGGGALKVNTILFYISPNGHSHIFQPFVGHLCSIIRSDQCTSRVRINL